MAYQPIVLIEEFFKYLLEEETICSLAIERLRIELEELSEKREDMTLPPLKQGVSRLHEEGELSPPQTGGGACLSPLRGGLKPTPM